MIKPKIPGVLTDPWRRGYHEPPPTPPTPKPEPAPTTSQEMLGEDYDEERIATIELPGYGGITVRGAAQTPLAVLQLLDCCVRWQMTFEPIFTEYGLVIAHIPMTHSIDVQFYFRRGDGWMLAAPAAKTREDGLCQLIQALCYAQTIPELRDILDKNKIRAFKM